MVKKLRESKGLTQSEIAERLQISVFYFNKIERGNRILTVKLAARIAKILGCTISDLRNSHQ